MEKPFQENEVHASETTGKFGVHTCPATAIAWTPNGYFCGGADRKIIIYGKNGKGNHYIKLTLMGYIWQI